jgi:NADPH:quinone reductase-like Zn-dependent oxidoreductase
VKALELTRHGGPEAFRLVDRPSGLVGAGEIRIEVKAAGINFADLMMRMGLYPEAPKLPFVPGYEVAGVVSETGPGVTRLRVGDRVMAGCRFGGYASEVVVAEYQARRTPAHLSDAEAASIPVNWMTAWVALHEMARVRRGDRVLVPSAAGGVGVAAVQLARLAGAEVTGLVGSEGKMGLVHELGAARVLLNSEWESADDRLEAGYDVILDAAGGESLKRAMRRLGLAGRVVAYGASSLVTGSRRNLPKVIAGVLKTPLYTPIGLMNQNKGVFGLNMLRFFEPPAPGQDPYAMPMARAFDGVVAAFERRELRAIVGKTFALADGGLAQEHLRSRGGVGKVVLVP